LNVFSIQSSFYCFFIFFHVVFLKLSCYDVLVPMAAAVSYVFNLQTCANDVLDLP
jgi:hypothetical protein